MTLPRVTTLAELMERINLSLLFRLMEANTTIASLPPGERPPDDFVIDDAFLSFQLPPPDEITVGPPFEVYEAFRDAVASVGVSGSFREMLTEMANAVDSAFAEFPATQAVARRMVDRALSGHQTWAAFYADNHEMKRRFLDEANAHVFLRLRLSYSAMYDEQLPFGIAVLQRFPAAHRNALAAHRCLALEEWDAVVYHLMMVAGEGLRALAVRLDVPQGTVPMSETFDYEEWGNVIDQIEKAVKRLQTMPRGQTKADALDFYSKVTSQSIWFKDAWRLSVAHGRLHADEREAIVVYNAVGEFMRLLASGLDQQTIP